LLAHAQPALPEALVADALDACGGNPLLLIQLAQSPDLQVSRVRGDQSHQRVLLARFLGIGAGERKFVQAASVLRPRFRTSLAAEMAGLFGEQLLGALQSLFAAGVLRATGDDRAEFVHALIREALYQEMAPAARVHLHQLAFRVLLKHDADPAEAAEHALAGQLTGDAETITTLTRAGHHALRSGAIQNARQHLQAAVDLAGESVDHALLLDLASVLLADGAAKGAIEVLERLLRSPSVPDQVRASALSLLGRACFMASRLERAALAFQAISSVSNVEPDLRVTAALDNAFWTWTCLGPGAGLEVASRARELSRQAAETLQACADAAWALCAYGSGDPGGATVALAAAASADLARLTSATAPH
jgi:hypothetical protein